MKWSIEHLPGKSFVIVCDDKTGEDRNIDELNKMFEEIGEVIGKYGFDLQLIGDIKKVYKYFEKFKGSLS